LGFSLDNQLSQAASYKAPDPMFIATVSAMSQGFPWDRFEHFFESQSLIKASAQDQVFLLRILALQEMLCLDDQAVLDWVKNQLYLFAFISPHYKPKIPSEALLSSFREKLDDINILEPFRLRCQTMILKYSAMHEVSYHMPDESLFSDYLYGKDDAELSTVSKSDLDQLTLEERWATCPVCDSASLQSTTHDTASKAASVPWAMCKQCGHQFKVR